MQSPDRASAAMIIATTAGLDIICPVRSLGPLASSPFRGALSGRKRPHHTAVQRVATKTYKGSKAAKRASRPKRKPTRRQRWAA